MIEKVNIRGIEVLAAKNEVTLVDFLMSPQAVKKGKLFAINAEKVVMCTTQPEVRQLLEQAEFCYADGISIVRAIKTKYPQITEIERVAGVDLWEALMKRATELAVPVFLVGSSAETLAQTQAKLSAWGVNIVGAQDGFFRSEEENAVIAQIVQSGAQFVTVAMGSPKQEQFIVKAQQQHPDALYMGVGGTYDVFTGKVKRAPKIWRKLGLEWLYRLLSQPTRWRRQLNLIRFAYYYFTKQL